MNNLLKKHAKSFYWASFLSKDTVKKSISLYNFCRTLDDIADNVSDIRNKKKILQNLKRIFK